MTRWLAGFAVALASSAWAHKPTVTTFTYHDDIRPIFEAKCGSCHRAGGVAPMSLLDYREAYPWAVAIKNEVLHLAMPPWFADDRYGAFKHGGGLTAREMNTIVDWCLGGSPEGEASGSMGDEGPQPGWALGAPDVQLAMPAPVRLDENTSETVEEVTLASGLERPGYVRAIDFRPGAANIVRSATVRIRGGDVPLATWIPGQVPEVLPPDRGYPLPAGAEIVLRLHYKKTWLDEGTAVEDESVVALYLHDGDAATPVDTIAVSPEAAHVVETDVELMALLPRLDAEVESLVADVVRPDGSRERILRLHQPSPDWPRKYWLQTPMTLPAGSRVEVDVTTSAGVSSAIFVDLASE